MGKINVDLQFTANTQQAKAQLDQLKNSLNQLGNMTNINLGTKNLTNDMIEASNAAIKLKTQLDAATNVNTGKLSLGKFNQELKASGLSLADYRQKLSALGPEGQKAFVTLTDSIISADKAISTGSKLLANFGQTLANVAKYQLSTAVYRGFTQAISTAYNYAQDLNKSLNNIRIVTGQSVEQMDKFAARANKAAKALSTTTIAYTDAALIFYQQGLNDKQVEERTNATIKMANVTGDSVKEVSNQLTAIWNNFAKGGKQLEYYVDVITALGAATASSTSEISEGLEKFAAVAETVGLSYEYATTALATVTAETRQSADVVGTAFKTLFARIQDLELGKTLEDGTTLGKYAQALQTIGVNVKTSTGEVKDMNTILDEMGAKWKQIDDATKIATAQAVAGTRQYAQLMALMENWDTFQTNLVTAQNSEGELDRQAQIYAESWEGARNRVKAALEEIYGALIDDKAFIKMTDGLAGIVKYIGDLVRNMGGLKGVLPMITGLMLQFAGPQIYNGLHKIVMDITNVIPNFKAWSTEIKQAKGFLDKSGALLSPVTLGETRAEGLRKDAITEAQKVYSDDKTLVGDVNRSGLSQRITLQQQLNALSDKLTATEREQAQAMIDRNRLLNDEIEKKAQSVEESRKVVLELTKQKELELEIAAENRRDDQSNFNADVKSLKSMGRIAQEAENNGGFKNSAAFQKFTGLDDAAFKQLTETELESFTQRFYSKLKNVTEAIAESINNDNGFDKKDNFGYSAAERIFNGTMTQNMADAYGGRMQGFYQTYTTGLDTSSYVEGNKSETRAAHAFNAAVDVNASGMGLTGESNLTALEEYSTKLKELGQTRGEGKTLIDEYRASVEALKQAQDVLNEAEANGVATETERNAVTQASEKVTEQLGKLEEFTAKKVEERGKAYIKVASDEKAAGKYIKEQKEGLDKLRKSNESLTKSVNNRKNIFKEANNSLLKMGKSNKTLGQSFASTTSGMIQFGNGLQMTISLFRTLGDESISTGQKLLTVLTMGLPAMTQMLNGIRQFGSGILGLATNIGQLIIQQRIKNGLDKKSLITMGEELVAKELLKQEDLEALKNDPVKLANKIREIALTNGVTAADMGEAAAKNGATAATKAQTVANWELLLSMPPILAIVIAILAVILVLVAAVVAITTAINNHNKALKHDQIMLDEANAALDRQKEALEAAKTAWKNLQDTINQYDSALKAINNLTVGTQAYNEAVQQANEAVLNLLSLYPQLEKYIKFENGHLVISEEGKEEATTLSQNDIATAQQLVLQTQIVQKQAEYRNNLTKALNDLYGYADTGIIYDGQNNRYVVKTGFWDSLQSSKKRQKADKGTDTATELIQKLEQAYANNDINTILEIQQQYTDEENKAIIKIIQQSQAAIQAQTSAMAATILPQSQNFQNLLLTNNMIATQVQNAFKDGIMGKVLTEQRKSVTDEWDALTNKNQWSVDTEAGQFKERVARAILIQKYGENPADIKRVKDGDYSGKKYYIGQTDGNNFTVYKKNDKGGWTPEGDREQYFWREEAGQWLATEQASDINNYEPIIEEFSNKADQLTKNLASLGLNNDSINNIVQSLLEENGTINFGNLSPKEAEIFEAALSNNPDLLQTLITFSNNKTAAAIEQAIKEINNDRSRVIKTEQAEAAKNTSTRHARQRATILSAAGLTEADFKNIETTFDEFKDLSDEAATVAIHAYGNAKSLGELWEAQGAILLNNTEDTIEYQQALTAVQTELEKIFGVSWTNEMIEEAGGWDALSEAATGSADAIKAFQKVAAENWLKNRGLDTATEKAFLNFSNAIEQGQNPQEALDNLNSLVGKKINIKDLETYLDLYNIAYELDKDGNQIVSIAKVDTERIQKVLQGIRDKALEKEYDHYYSINQKIQETEKSLDRLSKAKDKAYGVNRLRLMEQEEHILEQQIAEQEELIDIANKQVQIQKEKMLKTIGSGVDVKFTSNGRIANYEAIMEAVGPLRQEEVADAIDKYVEELDHISDAEEKIRDLQDDILASTYERYTYEIEIKTTANENDAKRIEYFLGKVEDDIYKVAEAAQYLEEQYDNIINAFDIQGESYSKLQDLYQQGEISQSDYVDGLQEQYDKTIENLEALNEFDNKMKEYYSETLSQAIEEIDKYIDRIEKSTDLLEHYQNLLKLTGHEFDYAKQLMLLDGFIDAERISVQKLADEVAFLESERVRVAQELAAADTDAAKEQYQKMLDDIDEQLSEKRSDWAEASEQLIERLHERFNTYLTSTFKEIEDKLTGGLGLDQLQQRMANLKTLADIYLDDTNKVYETNKMINQINQAIAKTDNKAAKDRYKGFIDDIKALQNKGQLTKTELELAQSRYKVLQAQIALEEAQNAKSMVRLRRDNEGNFGYVYTATDNQVSNAEQAVEDAENAYYNKRTTVVQNGIDKLLKLNSDYLQKIQDLWKKRQDGEIESDEELQRQLAELEQQYADEREGIMIGLQAAIGDVNTPDSIIGLLGEGWSSLLAKTEEVTQGMDDEVQAHMPEIQDEFNKTTEEANLLASSFIGSGNEGLQFAIQEVTNAAKKLADRLGSKDDKDSVIGKLNDTMKAASDLTEEWLSHKDQIDLVRQEYENLIKTIQGAIDLENKSRTGYQSIMASSLRVGNQVYVKDENGNWWNNKDVFIDDDDFTVSLINQNAKTQNAQVNAALSWVEKRKNQIGATEEQIKATYGATHGQLRYTQDLLNHYGDNGYIPNWISTSNAGKNVEPASTTVTDVNNNQVPVETEKEKRAKIDQQIKNIENIQSNIIGKKLQNKKLQQPLNAYVSSIDLNNSLIPDDWKFNIYIPDTGKSISRSGKEFRDFYDVLTTIHPFYEQSLSMMQAGASLNPFSKDLDLTKIELNYKDKIAQLMGYNSYDTGGYTGQWGPSGKLAMLHQKEIVLNADDTKNFLQAIDILRSIVSVIDLGAMQAMSGSMVSSSINSANNSLNQNVTIHAEFPNAVNHSEIEQAFDNLVNKASQYANRY